MTEHYTEEQKKLERRRESGRKSMKKWRERHPEYNERQREWRKKNHSRLTELARIYKKENSEKYRRYFLMSEYNISLEEYNSMLCAQNGVCAICGGSKIKGSSLAVDHCHKTGKVRGLLCFNCNAGIGQLKDSHALVLRAAKYLLDNS